MSNGVGREEELPHPRGLSIPLPRGGCSSSCSNFDFYLRERESEVSKSVPECLGEFWGDSGIPYSSSSKKKSLPSPRNIPKFIKHSLHKLWRSKSESPSNSSSSCSAGQQKGEEEEDGDDGEEADDDREERCSPASSPEIYDSISLTQSTQDFIAETRLIGLPLIPFKYPSCYLHDGHKPLLRKNSSDDKPPDLSSIITEADRQLNDEETTLSRINHHQHHRHHAAYVPESERDFFSFPFIDDEASHHLKETSSSDYIDMKPIGHHFYSNHAFEGLD